MCRFTFPDRASLEFTVCAVELLVFNVPDGPVAPVAPTGIVKFNTAAEEVPLLVTVAEEPSTPVVTVPTVIVAAAPSVPLVPLVPFTPWRTSKVLVRPSVRVIVYSSADPPEA